MFLHPGFQSPDCLSNVDLVTAAWNPVHNPGQLPPSQGVLYRGLHQVKGSTRPEDNYPHVKPGVSRGGHAQGARAPPYCSTMLIINLVQCNGNV